MVIMHFVYVRYILNYFTARVQYLVWMKENKFLQNILKTNCYANCEIVNSSSLLNFRENYTENQGKDQYFVSYIRG